MTYQLIIDSRSAECLLGQASLSLYRSGKHAVGKEPVVQSLSEETVEQRRITCTITVDLLLPQEIRFQCCSSLPPTSLKASMQFFSTRAMLVSWAIRPTTSAALKTWKQLRESLHLRFRLAG